MQTYIAILRGINVGSQKKVLMAELKEVLLKLKLREVVTYIQSGNVVFKSEERLSNEEFASKMEKAIAKHFKFQVPVLVRNAAELKKIVDANIFAPKKNIDLSKLHVTFLSDEPEKTLAEGLKKISFLPDEFLIKGKEVYLHIPVSYGETKLSNKFFENKLKVTATTRNWKTVNTLLEMCAG
ncbi:MAG: DUF1697 domain-containing protein [Bacteroidota bacterium]|nr:DUF1697 domain-containing protein [Bacteroidota bacterium]